MDISQFCVTFSSLVINLVILPFFITIYVRTKRKSISMLIFGWISIFLAIFFKLLYIIYDETLFFTIDIIFVFLGYSTIIIGINMYFFTFNNLYIILINIISSTLILVIHFIITYVEAVMFGRFLTGIAIIAGLVITFNNRGTLKDNLGIKGLEWVILTYFLGILVIVVFSLISLYFADIAGIGDLILEAYLIGIAINIINLEQKIAINERNLLKDKFSHEITNFNQYFVMGIEMIQYEKNKLSTNSQEILNNIQKQLKESNELLDKIRNL